MPGLQGNTAVRFSEVCGVGGDGAAGDAGDFRYFHPLLAGSFPMRTLGSGGSEPFARLGHPTKCQFDLSCVKDFSVGSTGDLDDCLTCVNMHRLCSSAVRSGQVVQGKLPISWERRGRLSHAISRLNSLSRWVAD